MVQNGLSAGIVPSSLKRRILPSGVVQVLRVGAVGVLADRHVQLAVGAEVQRAAVVVGGADSAGRSTSTSSLPAVLPLTVKRLTRLCGAALRGRVVDVDEAVAREVGMRRHAEQAALALVSTATVSIVPIAAPLLAARAACRPAARSAGGRRAACANAVAADSPVTKFSLRVKPAGCVREPPNCTVTLIHADWLPAASMARTRSTCWPEANSLLSTVAL